MPNFGDVDAKELNSIDTYCKKVLLYGWDGSTPVKVAVTDTGLLKVTI